MVLSFHDSFHLTGIHNSILFSVAANWRSWNQSKHNRKTFGDCWYVTSAGWRIPIHRQPQQSLCWQSCKNSNNRDAQKLFRWEGERPQCKGISSSRDLKIQWIWVCNIFFRRRCWSCYLIFKQCCKFVTQGLVVFYINGWAPNLHNVVALWTVRFSDTFSLLQLLEGQKICVNKA